MVVLTEEFHGLSLKRKGADEPELFDAGGDDRSGLPPACRATKMRRLACPDDGPHHRWAEPATAGEGDVPMGEGDAAAAAAPSSPGAGSCDDDKALVVYGDAPRSAPPVAFRVHADWVRAMLREADSRTVRELLDGARERGSGDLALAVVPWVATSVGEEAEPSAAEEATTDDSEGAAAMDVEGEEEEVQGRPWAGQTYGAAVDGFVYRWPQHCMATPQIPAVAVAQASPVMWSW